MKGTDNSKDVFQRVRVENQEGEWKEGDCAPRVEDSFDVAQEEEKKSTANVHQLTMMVIKE